jgi:hypothetical protein
MKITRGPFNYSSPGPTPNNAQNCNQYILTRLLLGNLKISYENKRHDQILDYSKLTPIQQTQSNAKAFSDFISNEGIAKSVNSFITKTITDNRPFYEDLLWEFSNYFHQTGIGSHTAAFIFLYRVLERVSYSIPALYFSCSNDYYATFNDLQNILNEGGQGELGLFKKFISQNNFLDQNEKSVIYDINFSSQSSLESKYFNTVQSKIKPNLAFHDISIHKMQIRLVDILDFFKNTRNRFFHSRTGDGQRNIRAQEIENTDEFFSIINPIFCSFSSFIVLRSITKKYQ